MDHSSREVIRFKRNHFSSRLPVRYLYSASHFWLYEEESGVWRVGLTNFATRMLGEIVEYDFEVEPGQSVHVGQIVGWIEGFKAVSDVYSVADGQFDGRNASTAEDTEVICRDPYGDGWLYAIRGAPDPKAMDVHGYVSHLEATIDKMQERPWRSAEISEP